MGAAAAADPLFLLWSCPDTVTAELRFRAHVCVCVSRLSVFEGREYNKMYKKILISGKPNHNNNGVI